MSSHAGPPGGEQEKKIEEEDEEYRICREVIEQATEANEDYRKAYEHYLSKAVYYEIVKWGPFSGSIRIKKWDDSGFHPREIIVTLEYKTGDAANTPYAEHPVDQNFSRVFRKHGWKVEGKGLMLYGYRCWKCGKLIAEEELEYDEKGRRKCPECGATSTKTHQIRVVKGNKWLYAHKRIRLVGSKTIEGVREIVIQNIIDPVHEFAGD